MRSRRSLAGVLVVAGAVALLGPLVAAQNAATTLTVVSSQSGCPDGKTFCFEVSADGVLEAGTDVEIVFANEASGSHNVHAVAPDLADADHRASPADRAIVATATVEAGGNDAVSLTVPAGEGIYFWCSVSGHEQIGMWELVPIGSEIGSADGQGSGRWVPPVLIVLGLVLYVMLGRDKRH